MTVDGSDNPICTCQAGWDPATNCATCLSGYQGASLGVCTACSGATCNSPWGACNAGYGVNDTRFCICKHTLSTVTNPIDFPFTGTYCNVKKPSFWGPSAVSGYVYVYCDVSVTA